MKQIRAIIQPFMSQKVFDALRQVEDLPGLTMSRVVGWGEASIQGADQTFEEGGHTFAHKIMLDIVVTDELVDVIVRTIHQAAHTGNFGDGKIFVYDVADALKIRTGDCGPDAL
ncbi:MAG: P-II family nitrogen regulator [Deltaproteobacteria bacterium]|nr:P-II family nitrogen regulator [Deltaproteobacteria bacterium]